jgi:peptide-methionine (R)-S-oxide reductase
MERLSEVMSSSNLAHEPSWKKYAQYEKLCVDYLEDEDLSVYFSISRKPIDHLIENDMELLSDIVSWGERWLDHWPLEGHYSCARCSLPLYRASDKWKGPCVWPSFRQNIDGALDYETVVGYNGYECQVDELYCSSCKLFIGHRFYDAREKGDTSPNATGWRH